MSTFAFLPRSVKRRKTDTTMTQDQVSSRVASISTSAGAPIASEGQSSEKRPENAKGKTKERTESQTFPGKNGATSSSNKALESEDLARLVCLALSDYALWSDVDLRRKIDWAGDGQLGHEDDMSIDDGADRVDDDQGYIPLSYLKKNSTVFLQATSSQSFTEYPDITYMKALRNHASHLVDVRLALSDDGSFNFAPDHWSKNGSSSTGYEVRRKKKLTSLGNYGKSDWHNLTIYIENIPVQYRNVYGIAKLISSLLPPSESSISKIQNVSFPPHHNDRPGTLPTCKGFALVTLSTDNDVQLLLDEWHWEESKLHASKKVSESHSDDIIKRESSKFGLRCLSKSHWEELKAEYLLYRQQLIAEVDADNKAQEQINRISSDTTELSRHRKTPAVEECHHVPASKLESVRTPERGQKESVIIRADSPYPSGCLVFVRNVHSETNKTSLRTLFSQALKTAQKNSTSTANNSDGLDYVDYTKGLDSCYLRFSTPSHAQDFVDYFTSHSITQKSGLDGTGELLLSASKDGSTIAVITPELVSGKREELYWQKVPEKVRKQAVDKALKIMNDVSGKGSEPEQNPGKKRRRGK